MNKKKILYLFYLLIFMGFIVWLLDYNFAKKQFTFGWQFVDSNDMKPRGGTTFGPKVTIDDSLNKDWVSIREPNINKFER